MIEFLVETNGEIYEISELIKEISYTDKLNDGCSKLEFSYIDDDLRIQNGSCVRFKYDNNNIFFGYVFKQGQNKKKEISVTAYDQLRYCKAKDSIMVKNNTLTDLVKKMCLYFNRKTGNLTDTGYILATNPQDNKTWLDIIYDGINETLTNNGEWYSLRDEFGEVSIRNLTELQLELVLGDKNSCYDYSYEKSIDDEFYNQIKLVSENETTKRVDVYMPYDSSSIERYGLLQYYEVLEKNHNPAQARAKADALLKLYNREIETLSLECLGDVRIRAGSSYYGSIEDIVLNKRLIVRSVTHNFLPIHTMTMEVAI